MPNLDGIHSPGKKKPEWFELGLILIDYPPQGLCQVYHILSVCSLVPPPEMESGSASRPGTSEV